MIDLFKPFRTDFKETYIPIRKTIFFRQLKIIVSKPIFTTFSPSDSYSARIVYLAIIPRARMASESIAHEAEGRMGY